MQIYLQKSFRKVDFDEVLKLISAKMVDICGIYVCVYEKKAVILQRELSERVEKPSHFYIKNYVTRRIKTVD